MLRLEIKNGDGKVVGFDVGGSDKELIKKLGKSKGQILSKSQKSAKSGKNLSKSGNLPNFGAKKAGLSFLTPKARAAFNYLWLAFTEALIFQHFDPECHI